ncbi:unnamed protein product [Protopolystoma xenopodis]|uniref:Uncharacterized protein n=1 Tax=Protopolystoma xenopodis TaxID=117903 RepID=A0A3S5B7R2_9PLAT|nr:unnamed protein product [Protopolystoma xenopodis]
MGLAYAPPLTRMSSAGLPPPSASLTFGPHLPRFIGLFWPQQPSQLANVAAGETTGVLPCYRPIPRAAGRLSECVDGRTKGKPSSELWDTFNALNSFADPGLCPRFPPRTIDSALLPSPAS